MKLSILISSIPERREQAYKLFDKLQHQIMDRYKTVEILMLVDNCERSIGAKRNALLKIANGDYITYVDDDDDITDSFMIECLKAIETEADLIVFKHEAWINGKKYIIEVDKDNPNEQISDREIVKRKPLHSNLWKRELVKDIPFPDIMYGEDYQWAGEALKKINTQHKIDKVLHIYKYEARDTQAEKKNIMP